MSCAIGAETLSIAKKNEEKDAFKEDFIVANHGECDHSGSLTTLMEEIPDTPIYCTANAVKSTEGQYGKRGWNFHAGRHHKDRP